MPEVQYPVRSVLQNREYLLILCHPCSGIFELNFPFRLFRFTRPKKAAIEEYPPHLTYPEQLYAESVKNTVSYGNCRVVTGQEIMIYSTVYLIDKYIIIFSFYDQA
jgi:hypothetical protein